jgi:hypothetical protein
VSSGEPQDPYERHGRVVNVTHGGVEDTVRENRVELIGVRPCDLAANELFRCQNVLRAIELTRGARIQIDQGYLDSVCTQTVVANLTTRDLLVWQVERGDGLKTKHVFLPRKNGSSRTKR